MFPQQTLLRQLLKAADRLAVGNLHFLCQIFPRIDNVNLTVPVDPAVATGQLEAVEQEGVGHLALQRPAVVPVSYTHLGGSELCIDKAEQIHLRRGIE